MAKPRSAAWSATVKSVVLTAVLTGTAVVAVPVDSSVHATSNPDLANGLKSAAGKLVETSLLPELNELLPGLATNPGQLLISTTRSCNSPVSTPTPSSRARSAPSTATASRSATAW